MKKFTIILLVSLICTICKSQNLVPNPSFESYGTLPCSWITSQTGFNSAINDWIMPTNGSTDIFSTLVSSTCYAHCFSYYPFPVGHQAPRTGNVMSALNTYGDGGGATTGNYREYLEIQLLSPLVVGTTYYAEMYVSLGDFVNIASNNLGMYFSTSILTNYATGGVLNVIPQINETNIVFDTLNWHLISGTFTATSPMQYLTIGNFYSMGFTSTAIVGNSTHSSQVNARYFVDDISVSVATGSDELNTDISLNIFPNPFAEKLTISSNKNEQYELIIYDITSRIVIQETFKSSIILNTSQLARGVYLYEVRNENNVIRQGKVIRE